MKLSLCIVASLLLTLTEAALSGNWPPVDKTPPIDPAWKSLVDPSKVAKSAVIPADQVGKQCEANDPYCNWSCTGCTRNDSDIIKCPNKGDWGITFDDGPTEFTTGLLDFFRKTNTKVTFFVIGSRVHDNPEILQQAVKDGHQIGVHTWSHPSLTSLTNEQIISEIKWTEKAIKAAVGLTPKYMRPPFGDFDDRVRNICTQLGYKVVIWDYDTNDWKSAEDKTFQLNWIEGNFTQWVKTPSTTGHISLEHDLYQQTAARGQICAPIVTKAGYTIKPVSVCTGDSHPYVENVSLGQLGNTNSSSPSSSLSSSGSSSGDSSGSSSGNYPSAGSSSGNYPSAGSSSGNYPSGGSSGAYPYLVSSQTPSPSSNAASLNGVGLLSFASLVMGSLMFI